MGVRRVISCFGGSWATGAGTQYCSVLTPIIFSDDQADAETHWLAPTYFRGLHIVLDTAPGSGNAWTFTILVNGVATDISVTISDAATEASVADHLFGYAPLGSLVTLRRSPTGTPDGAEILDYGLIVDGVESNISLYGGSPGPPSDCTHLLNPGGWYGTVLNFIGDILPVATTIKTWAVHLGDAPGTGDSRTFTAYSRVPAPMTEWVEQFSITISDDEVDGSVSPDITFPAGTLLQVRATGSGSPPLTGSSWCVRARIAGQDGQSITSTSADPTIKHDGTGWYGPDGLHHQDVDEALSATTVRAAFTIRSFYFKQFDGTQEGTEWFFMTRRAFADTDAVLNLEGPTIAGEYGFLEGVEVPFAAGDAFDVQVSNGGMDTNNGNVGQWSWLVSALSEDEPGTIGPLLWVEWPRLVP